MAITEPSSASLEGGETYFAAQTTPASKLETDGLAPGCSFSPNSPRTSGLLTTPKPIDGIPCLEPELFKTAGITLALPVFAFRIVCL